MNKKIWKTTLVSAITVLTTAGLLSSFLTLPPTNTIKNSVFSNENKPLPNPKANQKTQLEPLPDSNLNYHGIKFSGDEVILDALEKLFSVPEMNGFPSLSTNYLDLYNFLSTPKLPSIFLEELENYTGLPITQSFYDGLIFLAPLLTAPRVPSSSPTIQDLFFWPETATTVAENHQQFKDWWLNTRLRYFLNSFLNHSNPNPTLKKIIDNSPFELIDDTMGYPFLFLSLSPRSAYRTQEIANDLTGELSFEITLQASGGFNTNRLPITPNYDKNAQNIFFEGGSGGRITDPRWYVLNSTTPDPTIFPNHPTILNNILKLNINNKILPIWYTPEQLKNTFAWSFTDRALNSNFQKFNQLSTPIQAPLITLNGSKQEIGFSGNVIKTKTITSFKDFIDFYRDILGPNFNYNFNNLNNQNITYIQSLFKKSADVPSIVNIMLDTIIPTLPNPILQKIALVTFFQTNFAFMDLVATTLGLTKPSNDTSDKIFIWDNIKTVLDITDADFENLAQYHLDQINGSLNPLKIPPSVFGFLDNSFVINFKKLDNAESLVGSKFDIKKTSFDLTFRIKGLLHNQPQDGVTLQQDRGILFKEKDIEVALVDNTLDIRRDKGISWKTVNEILDPNNTLPETAKVKIASELDVEKLKKIILNKKSDFWVSNFDTQKNFTINPTGQHIPNDINYGQLSITALELPEKEYWKVDDNRGIIWLESLSIEYRSDFNNLDVTTKTISNIRIDFKDYPIKFPEAEYFLENNKLSDKSKDFTQTQYKELKIFVEKINNSNIIDNSIQRELMNEFFTIEMKSKTGKPLDKSQRDFIQQILKTPRTLKVQLSPLQGNRFTLTFEFNSLKITDENFISFEVFFHINPTFFPLDNQVVIPPKPPVVSDIGTITEKSETPINFGEIAIWLFPVIAISIGAILLAVYCFIQYRKKI